mmetsp:Transcript_36715/g.92046  ORF Transcript_36715/g.92046 Transcript_36715/m.92046 type:complete len:217 (-) Transcript_36715:713-1363(-)
MRCLGFGGSCTTLAFACHTRARARRKCGRTARQPPSLTTEQRPVGAPRVRSVCPRVLWCGSPATSPVRGAAQRPNVRAHRRESSAGRRAGVGGEGRSVRRRRAQPAGQQSGQAHHNAREMRGCGKQRQGRRQRGGVLPQTHGCGLARHNHKKWEKQRKHSVAQEIWEKNAKQGEGCSETEEVGVVALQLQQACVQPPATQAPYALKAVERVQPGEH